MWKRVWGLGDGVVETGMAPRETGSRRREVARQLPRAEERNLEGGDAFKSAVCAVGGYLWPEQTDPRGGSTF